MICARRGRPRFTSTLTLDTGVVPRRLRAQGRPGTPKAQSAETGSMGIAEIVIAQRAFGSSETSVVDMPCASAWSAAQRSRAASS